jgi:hypothetical protein
MRARLMWSGPPALSQACSNPHHGPTAPAAGTPGVAEGPWRRGLPGGAVLADGRFARNTLLLAIEPFLFGAQLRVHGCRVD